MLSRMAKPVSALCVLACVALLALWVRSYHHADRVHGRLSEQNSFLLASKQGRVTAVAFRWDRVPDWWNAGFRTFAVNDEMSFPVGSVRRHEAGLGFGRIRDPMYMVTRSTFETPEGATILISGAAVATLRGSGILVPYWCLMLLSGLAGIALQLERPWRYTTRSLLIAFTFVAIVLGLVASLDQGADTSTVDIPAPLDEL
jgi:hypothetical protein